MWTPFLMSCPSVMSWPFSNRQDHILHLRRGGPPERCWDGVSRLISRDRMRHRRYLARISRGDHVNVCNCTNLLGSDLGYLHRSWEATWAPSAMACSLAQTISGST